MNDSKLFEPVNIGTLEVRNRLAMAAGGRDFAGINGKVTDRLIHCNQSLT